MRFEDVKVGMKVVPTKQTGLFGNSLPMKMYFSQDMDYVKNMKKFFDDNGFLYVAVIWNNYVLLRHDINEDGDCFLASDFEPYVETKLSLIKNKREGVFGVVGTPTKMTYQGGGVVHVGDIVDVFIHCKSDVFIHCKSIGYDFVVDDGEKFIMGLKREGEEFRYGRFETIWIKLVKKYYEVKENETVGCIKAVKIEEYLPQKLYPSHILDVFEDTLTSLEGELSTKDYAKLLFVFESLKLNKVDEYLDSL